MLLLVDAPAQQFEVWLHGQRLKVCPIRNLFHSLMPLETYLEAMLQAAQSEEKRLQVRRRRQQRAA